MYRAWLEFVHWEVIVSLQFAIAVISCEWQFVSVKNTSSEKRLEVVLIKDYEGVCILFLITQCTDKSFTINTTIFLLKKMISLWLRYFHIVRYKHIASHHPAGREGTAGNQHIYSIFLSVSSIALLEGRCPVTSPTQLATGIKYHSCSSCVIIGGHTLLHN